MMVQEFLNSPTFLRFYDEDLYREAEKIVNKFFEELEKKPLARAQIKGIEAAITQGGVKEVKELSKHQLEKAKKKVNEGETSDEIIFWKKINDAIENNHPDNFCLRKTATKLLDLHSLLPSNKNEAKRAIDEVIETLGTYFFEHLCCHYYYKENLFRKRG